MEIFTIFPAKENIFFHKKTKKVELTRPLTRLLGDMKEQNEIFYGSSINATFLSNSLKLG